MQKSPQTWEKLKEFWIKKLHAEIGFRTTKIVSCHIAMETIRLDVEKFKGGNITNCFEKWANITQDQFVLYILKYQCASLHHPGISLLRKLKLLMQEYSNFSVMV